MTSTTVGFEIAAVATATAASNGDPTSYARGRTV